MQTTLEKIVAKAQQIRKAKPAMQWKDCIKEASKSIGAVKKKALPKNYKEVVELKKKETAKRIKANAKKAPEKKEKKRDHTRQTGTSNKYFDKRLHAQPPGYRESAAGNIYYERRKNRSDKPGQLTGIPQSELPGRIGAELKHRENAVTKMYLLADQLRRKDLKPGERAEVKKALNYYRKLHKAATANISNLKKLL